MPVTWMGRCARFRLPLRRAGASACMRLHLAARRGQAPRCGVSPNAGDALGRPRLRGSFLAIEVTFPSGISRTPFQFLWARSGRGPGSEWALSRRSGDFSPATRQPVPRNPSRFCLVDSITCRYFVAAGTSIAEGRAPGRISELDDRAGTVMRRKGFVALRSSSQPLPGRTLPCRWRKF